MPFGNDCEYATFAECVADNQDKENPQGYCATLEEQTKDHCASSKGRAVMKVPYPQRLAAHKDSIARRMVDYALANGLTPADLPTAELPWYRIQNREETSDFATVLIYDEIGGSFGVDAQRFAEDLDAIDAKEIRVRINSPGGSVYDGIAIYNAINHKRDSAHIVVYGDSLVASIASVIAMAGDEIVMMPGSQMMIHDAWATAEGNPRELAELSTWLDRQSDNLADIYAARAGGERGDWRARMVEETWLFADETVEIGLADRLETRQPPPDEDKEVRSLMGRQHNLRRFKYEGRKHAPEPGQSLRRGQAIRRWQHR